MDNLVVLIFVFGAIWRTSSLLTEEIGPFYIFIYLRYLMGFYYVDAANDERELTFSEIKLAILTDTLSVFDTRKRSALAELISCIYCSSIWVSAFFILCYSLFVYPLTAFEFSIITLTGSALAIYFNGVINA